MCASIGGDVFFLSSRALGAGSRVEPVELPSLTVECITGRGSGESRVMECLSVCLPVLVYAVGVGGGLGERLSVLLCLFALESQSMSW